MRIAAVGSMRHPFENHIQTPEVSGGEHDGCPQMLRIRLTLNANYIMFSMSKLDGNMMLGMRC
jgi:hypothetical protein